MAECPLQGSLSLVFTVISLCLMYRFFIILTESSTIIFPLLIRIIRSHTFSISAISCEVRNIVVESSSDPIRALTSAHHKMESFEMRSKPIVGSSRNRISGLCKRLATSSQRILSPRESSFTGLEIKLES